MRQALPQQRLSTNRDRNRQDENSDPVESQDYTLQCSDVHLTFQQYQALLEVSESIAVHRDLQSLFHDLAQRLPRIVPFDFINLVLYEPTQHIMRLHLLIAPESVTIKPGLELPIDESPGGLVWKTQEPVMVADVVRENRFPKLTGLLRENGVQSFCT